MRWVEVKPQGWQSGARAGGESMARRGVDEMEIIRLMCGDAVGIVEDGCDAGQWRCR